jgi:hypothetical protein
MANIPSIISSAICLLAVIASIVLVILYYKGIIKIPKNILPQHNTQTFNPSQYKPVNENLEGNYPAPLKASINNSSKPHLTPSVPSSKPLKIVQPINSSRVTWKGLQTSIKSPVDKVARDCIARGGIYTGGENKKFPGCGNHVCCQSNKQNWMDGQSAANVNWVGVPIKDSKECIEKGGIFTGGNNTKFSGCGGHSCCNRVV